MVIAQMLQLVRGDRNLPVFLLEEDLILKTILPDPNPPTPLLSNPSSPF
jgi:hypothetical protein